MPALANSSTPHGHAVGGGKGGSVGKELLAHPRPRVQSPSPAAPPTAAIIVPHTSAATVEWVKSQEVLKTRGVSGASSSVHAPASADGASNGSFDLAAGMADAETEIFYDIGDCDRRNHDAVLLPVKSLQMAAEDGDPCTMPVTSVVRTDGNGPIITNHHPANKKSDEREACATARHTDSDVPVDVGGLSERADDMLEDVDAMSYAESDNGLASSAGAHCCNANPLMSLRKRNEYENAIQLARAVQDDAVVCGALSGALNEYILDPLVPSAIMLHRRHELVERVCFHVTQALRLAGVQCHVAFYVFGSVHLRTVLPDGDIDITIVLIDGEGGGGGAISTSSPSKSVSTPTSAASASTPQTSGLSTSGSNMDLLPKVRDYLLATPSTGIFVDSLIFAEVRVLKLICEGLSIDFTVGQTGGTSTVCFLHQVDQRIGRQHLFKRTLLLLKAWANYEARILSGQGGYLGTYALTVMLIAIMNTVLQRIDAEEGSNARITPLSLMLNVFAYFSTFDFDTYCLTIYGPLPIAAMQRGGGGDPSTLHSASVQSAASTVTCDFCEDDAPCDASSVVLWPRDGAPNGAVISEAFVGECTATFGQGSADPAASTPPNATPLMTPPHREVPSMPELQPSMASEEAARGPRGDNVSSSTSSSNHHEQHPVAGGGHKKGVRKSPPQFSSALLTAATTFPIRSMNVMDPLRPSSNLTRGVSRAHLMRIQAAMALGLQQCGRAVSDCTSGRHDPTACVRALLPNTADVIDAFQLRQVMAASADGEPLQEAFFGGLCHCSGCPKPTMLCVAEGYLRRPELVAVTQRTMSYGTNPHHHHHQGHGGVDQHTDDRTNHSMRQQHAHHQPADRFGQPHRGGGARRLSSSGISPGTGHNGQHHQNDSDGGGGTPSAPGRQHHPSHHHPEGVYRGASTSSYARPTDILPEDSLASRIFPTAGMSSNQHHHHQYPSYLHGLPNRRHNQRPHAAGGDNRHDGMHAGGFQTHVTAMHQHHHHAPRSAQPQQPLTMPAPTPPLLRQHVDPSKSSFATIPPNCNGAQLGVAEGAVLPGCETQFVLPPQQHQQREVSRRKKGARQAPGAAISSSSSTPSRSEPPPLNSELFPSLPS